MLAVGFRAIGDGAELFRRVGAHGRENAAQVVGARGHGRNGERPENDAYREKRRHWRIVAGGRPRLWFDGLDGAPLPTLCHAWKRLIRSRSRTKEVESLFIEDERFREELQGVLIDDKRWPNQRLRADAGDEAAAWLS